jgi:DNA (cytosine-5)-methyltransferase 1
MTVLDLFAGCGGLSIGLKHAGLDVKWANEIDAGAAATYSLNHPQSKLYREDAVELLSAISGKATSYPKRGEVDVLTGGPPCQGFCQINRHRKFTDSRNSLIEVFYEFVKTLKPRAVLMENVTGILTLQGGLAINSLLAALDELGYATNVGILQAGCFGIPQNRWRVFVIACSDRHRQTRFPIPTHSFHSTNFVGMRRWQRNLVRARAADDFFGSTLKRESTVFDAISDLPHESNSNPGAGVKYRSNATTCYQRFLRREGSAEVLDHDCLRLEEISLQRCRHISEGGGWQELPKSLQPLNLARYTKRKDAFPSRWGRLSWDKPFSTILTKPEPYWGRYLHPCSDRVISARECARAQSFADDYVFAGSLASKYRQIGNAVPPILGEALGSSIVDLLSKAD